MDQKVKSYLEKLPSPQREICKKVRKIILKTFPEIKETFENGVPWYEDRFYVVGLRDHVNIGFSIKGLTNKELGLFEGKGKLMRHIKIYSFDSIDEQEIVKRLKIVKNKE